MSMKARKELLERQGKVYPRRNKAGKSRMIQETVEATGLSRKHVIKVLGGRLPVAGASGKRRGGRSASYGEAEAKVLLAIWRAANYLCSQRLVPVVELWLPHYERRFGAIEAGTRANLLKMSASSVGRLLAPWKAREGKRRLCTTKPGTLARLVEVRTENWDIKGPGHMEADTVSHGGGSTAGDYVWSLTATDIWTGWTETRAFWNKGREATLAAVRDMETSLPFKLLSFDSDNGGEFLNHHLYGYLVTDREEPVKFTRSRPYRKNDQAHVEQKNWTCVRELVGYDRLPHPEQAKMLNEVYARECSLYNNLFLPSMKCTGTEQRPGRKPRRIYDKAATPLDRLSRCPEAAPATIARLLALREMSDPFALSKAIRRKIDSVLSFKP